MNKELRDIRIKLNGEERLFAAQTTIAGLIESLDLPAVRMAVELNGEVVSRTDWSTHALSDNDRVEVVHFVGGG
ncbi:MAG: sulfur carrier protein ThiS [Pyrinomonadaceae bacterium]